MRDRYKEENMRQGGASHEAEVFQMLLQYPGGKKFLTRIDDKT